MSTCTDRIAVAGVLMAVAACTRPAAVRRTPGPATAYAGVQFERAAELPAPDAPPSAPGPVAPSAVAGTAAFPRACAMRLRDPRDGREFLLVRSVIAAPVTTNGATTVTRLERATGDYALVSSDRRRQEAPPYLRVDCVSGRALAWVAPGA